MREQGSQGTQWIILDRRQMDPLRPLEKKKQQKTRVNAHQVRNRVSRSIGERARKIMSVHSSKIRKKLTSLI